MSTLNNIKYGLQLPTGKIGTKYHPYTEKSSETHVQ